MRDWILEQKLLDQPVRSLQQMLRTVHFVDDRIPIVAPNGIFDAPTERALKRFQRCAELPVTGEADLATWEALVQAYDQARVQLAPARPLRVIVQRGQTLAPLHQLVYEAALEALSRVLEIPGDRTRWLQRCAGLPETGIPDRDTWDALSRLYPAILGDGRE